MNMWYKLVENQRPNFEVLAKFLIHNLSTLMARLRAQAIASSQSRQAD